MKMLKNPNKGLLLALFLCLTVSVFANSIGDVNGDNVINIVDALMVAQYTVGLSPNSFTAAAADVNNSNSINIVDALMIAQYYVGLISTFPAASSDPVTVFQNWAKTQTPTMDLTKYKVTLIKDAALDKMLPGYSFLSVLHIIYPVASYPEDSRLGSNSIVAVSKSRTIEILPSLAALQTFYRAHQFAPLAYTDCKTAFRAWMLLSQEYRNDGYYTFTIPEDKISIIDISALPRYQVLGVSEVASGGSGVINAHLYFDVNGLLEKVEETAELVAGVRPICQSTKLLDKDPLVRRMAEQDLLVMGIGIKDYLFTQRAKAKPALQKEMDRVWEKILEREAKLQRVNQLLK